MAVAGLLQGFDNKECDPWDKPRATLGPCNTHRHEAIRKTFSERSSTQRFVRLVWALWDQCELGCTGDLGLHKVPKFINWKWKANCIRWMFVYMRYRSLSIRTVPFRFESSAVKSERNSNFPAFLRLYLFRPSASLRISLLHTCLMLLWLLTAHVVVAVWYFIVMRGTINRFVAGTFCETRIWKWNFQGMRAAPPIRMFAAFCPFLRS